MIPDHLKGLSAAQICDKMSSRWLNNLECTERGYINFLEGCLLLAVKDALCVCDDVNRGAFDAGPAAAGRALAFLNMVSPDDTATSQN